MSKMQYFFFLITLMIEELSHIEPFAKLFFSMISAHVYVDLQNPLKFPVFCVQWKPVVIMNTKQHFVIHITFSTKKIDWMGTELFPLMLYIIYHMTDFLLLLHFLMEIIKYIKVQQFSGNCCARDRKSTLKWYWKCSVKCSTANFIFWWIIDALI